MNDSRTSLFCDLDLAARIERAESQFMAECTRAVGGRTGGNSFSIPLAGGVASFAEADSPYNKVAGLGFDGVPTAAELDEVERAYAACGAPVQVELSNLADPETLDVLTGRGYRLVSFENVLGRALAGGVEPAVPLGMEVRRTREEEFEDWLDVVVRATLHPDTQGVPWYEDFPRHILENAERDGAAAGVVHYSALRDGVILGGGGLRVADGIAQMAGAGTAPEHRRQGVQTALTTARLADAAAAGCDIAVVTTQPGSKSQENVQRQGFGVLYTRAVLAKQP
ncbi:GNAT family N-acetyltransferase [Actinacidiphila bryophytorum]|uniref:Acetyltransferase (GNAT) family protein n=1 Tax=Actinacidiphila bryophytorum TaxID=1436133 RepID=A0A9W4E3G8_9ACTN|nr:GNAT family N-acetyltransferase [Actinacidiphila bryophytorum]MBM9434390.1 GNAT family N-acetyltransferase [Actinacidiphila bryophytorum]MBN6544419.1 GNAT family N-acetyltransferase [Actinacidiphila bryophytorum]CAG7625502.1 Acetyltransferase (GNAT) family protein [Actinacidiphila bryophytorum]